MSLLGISAGLATIALLSRSHHLRSLVLFAFGSSNCLTLDFSPSQLTWPDRIFLLFVLLYKALLAVIGHSSSKLKASSDGQALFDLPLLKLTCPVQVSSDDRRRYEDAIMLPQDGEHQHEAFASPFVTAAITNPLMLLLVVHPTLPIAPLGAVNVRNRFEFLQVRPPAPGSQLTASAVVGGPDNRGRRTRRGIELDITVTVYEKDQVLLRQVITIMKPLPKHVKPAPPQEQGSLDLKPAPDHKSIGIISFPSHAPTLWASLCGDYNPIHMSSLLARLFGLPGRIAHGNHVVASFLQLAQAQPVFGRLSSQPWYLEVDFRRPMCLPMKLQADLGADFTWTCTKEGKTYAGGKMGHL